MSGGPESWLNILFEYEAVSCLAGLNYIQKKWSFPQIVADGFTYDASQISHPLIFKGKAVANDFVLNDNPATWIITGSNMSGKSTFLRTLGINAVLAFAGAPVAASEMKLSRFLVFTSMRTEDNLQESTSSFYAELKRLKQLLEYINDQIPVFYLLDEILKGTNSSDRNTGGKALIRQLQGTNSSGIIATHDIELSNLEKEAPGKIYNFSFSSDVTDGQLFFDYKLKEGVCRSFNATELMRQIGIQVDLGR
jgi:DNA mismatch repair ATPase MutS